MRQVQGISVVLGFLAVTTTVAFPQTATTRFSTTERCLTYRVFDSSDRTVNLRRSANGAVVKAVPNGTQVLDPYPETPPMPAGWTPVSFQKQIVYVSNKLLYRLVQVVNDPSDRTVNLRQEPNGRVIKALPNGTEVVFLEPQGGWTKVRLITGETGYVFSRFLKPATCW